MPDRRSEVAEIPLANQRVRALARRVLSPAAAHCLPADRSFWLAGEAAVEFKRAQLRRRHQAPVVGCRCPPPPPPPLLCHSPPVHHWESFALHDTHDMILFWFWLLESAYLSHSLVELPLLDRIKLSEGTFFGINTD
jgi:hypothetical protein